MLRLFQNRHIKRILASVILLQYLIFAGTTDVYAYGNAKQVQQDYISLMNGAYVADLGDSIYSYDDLRNIAIFLSNSYVPFYTSLDADSEDNSKKTSEAMLRQLGFSKDTAEQVVAEIYNASLSTASKVYIDYTELGDEYSNSIKFIHSIGRSRPKATDGVLSTTERVAEVGLNIITFGISGLVGEATGATESMRLKATSSCLVTGSVTPYSSAINSLKSLGAEIVSAISNAFTSAKNKLSNLIYNLWNKPTGVSQSTVWGETTTDASQCNAEAISTAIGAIKAKLVESGVPDSQIDIADVTISYGDYNFKSSKIYYTGIDDKKHYITHFVDIPGSMLKSMNITYLFDKNKLECDPKDTLTQELDINTKREVLDPVCDMVGVSHGTMRLAPHYGEFWDKNDEPKEGKDKPSEIEIKSTANFIHHATSDNDAFDRSDGLIDSRKACNFGTQMCINVRVGESAYILFTCNAKVSAGHFVYSNVYTHESDDGYDCIANGWQNGTSETTQQNIEYNASVPMGTLSTEGYMSAVGDDTPTDQFTPLTLYMFMNILDNMSRDNREDIKKNHVESTGYINKTQQYPVHLYYRENLQPILCGQIDDWILEVMYYVSTHTDYSERKQGLLGSYIVNGSVENFIDKTEEIVTDTNKMEDLMSLFQNMYVDWVGNILVDQGDQRIVVIPACLNPYTFTTLQSTGGDAMRNLIPASSRGLSTKGIAGSRTDNKYRNAMHTVDNYADRLTDFDGNGFHFVPTRNLVSVLGIKMIKDSANKYVEKTDDAITFKAIQPSQQAILPLVMERGKTGAPTWDFTTSLGTAGGTALAETLRNEYGFISYAGENNKWTTDSNILLTPKQHRCVKPDNEQYFQYMSYNTYLPEFIVYKQIRQSMDNSNTVFSTGNLIHIDDYSESTFFEQTANSLKLDDSFSFNLAFNSSDTWMLQNIYLTYTLAYINGEEGHGASSNFNSTVNYVNMKYNDIFPRMSGTIDWDVTDIMDESIREFTYYLLHPTKGIAYVATWFKNKIAGIFLRIHEDIVGAADSNASTGMTKYISFTGYVTTPALGDIDWISSFVDSYNDIIVYLIIIMMLIILCFVLANNITPLRGVIGFIAFAFLAFMPPVLINFTIDASNKVCDWIYGQKFDYWAIVQTNEYIGSLADVEAADGTTDYIAALYQATAVSTGDIDTGGESTSGYSGVKIKWLSPKKYNELGAFSDELLARIGKAKSGLTGWTVTGLVVGQSNANSTEFFLDSDSSTYIYRDILDIYRYGSSPYYMNLNDKFFKDGHIDSVARMRSNSDGVFDKSITDRHGNNIQNVLANGTTLQNNIQASQRGSGSTGSVPQGLADCSSLTHVRKGFLVDTPDIINESGAVSSSSKNYFDTANATANLYIFGNSRATSAIQLIKDNYKRFLESYKAGNINITPEKICLSTANQGEKHGCNFGIDQDYFKFGINEVVSGQIDDKQASFFQYGLYSESPYYYFSYNIRDHAAAVHNYNYDYSSEGLIQNTKMYHMLLDNNQDYFFNYNVESGDGYGELRDFMNFHDLFYYVIPALTTGNDLVNAWAQLYGMTPTMETSLRLDADGMITYNGEKYETIEDTRLKEILGDVDSETLYNFWLNYNIRTIYNCYTSWLYAMQSCDYATKPETIYVAGEKFIVGNPLDPYSYNIIEDGQLVEGRYMIFSRSEQKYYGLLDSDLTEVERKLLAVEDAVYADAIDLMNYYTICDESFIQTFALMETFDFNKEFSESSAFGSSFPLYPQTYELKAFTYDAYLRMIVAGSMDNNSDGERLQSTTRSNENKSIYERVQENTSIFFSIILIISDLVAVYVIPTLKIIFICILFFVSILVIISAVTGIENPSGNILQAFWKSLLAPLISYFAISVGMAFIVSMFMSNGADKITGQTRMPRIALGDPTTTVLAITVINIVACICYWKILKKMGSDLKTYFKTVFDNIGAAITGAVKKVGGVIVAGRSWKALKNLSSGAGGAQATGSAKSRGIENTSPKPKAVGSGEGEGGSDGEGGSGSGGSGSGGDGALAGAAAGAAGGTLGKTAADQVIDAHQKKSKEDKQLDKLDNRESKLNKEREQLENRMKDGLIGKKNYAKQKARLEKKGARNEKGLNKLANKSALAAEKAKAKDDRAKSKAAFRQNKANNVAKYGRVGAIKANAKLTGEHLKNSANSRAQGAAKSLGRTKGNISNGITSVKKGASSAIGGAKAIGGKVQKFATNEHYRGHVVDSAKSSVVSGAQRAAGTVKRAASVTADVAKGAASSASQIASDAGATYRKTSHAEMSSATRSRIIDRKTGRNSTRKS